MNSLTHFGIKGMKWGIRRTPEQLGHRRAKKGSEDYQRSRELKKKGQINLSNQELKELTTRMHLEQQYNKLNPNVIKKGSTTVKSIVAVGGTITTAYAFYNSPPGQAIKKEITKAITKG